MSESTVSLTSIPYDDDEEIIFNVLENSNLEEHQSINFQSIKERLDEVAQWMKVVVLKVALCDNIDKESQFVDNILDIRRTGFMIINQTHKTCKGVERYDMRCSTCGLTINDLHHEHIEKVWADYLEDINAEKKKISEAEKYFESELYKRLYMKMPLMNGLMYDQVVINGYYPGRLMNMVYLTDAVPVFTIQRILCHSLWWCACLLCKNHDILGN